LVTTRTYNDDNTTAGISVAGRADLSFTYGYDVNKNVTSETSTGTVMSGYATTVGFDAKDRLDDFDRANGDSQDWTLSFESDWLAMSGLLDGNTFSETRNHNDVHEITAINSTSVAHDAKGNLTRNAGDTVDRYTWDFDNRLAAADTDQDGSDDVTFAYDALGRRVTKDNGTTITRYIRTGQRVIEEYASTGGAFTLQRSYVYGSYIDDILAKVAPGSGELYYHRDRQYSVRGLTDNSGAIVELYAYSPYGKQVILDAAGTVRSATAHNNLYGFTGRYLDPETGLWYFRARYFDAEHGRFIGRDPLGYPDGPNRYAAYHVMHGGVDPSGHFVQSREVTFKVTEKQSRIELDAIGWYFRALDGKGPIQTVTVEVGQVKAYEQWDCDAGREKYGIEIELLGTISAGTGAKYKGVSIVGKSGYSARVLDIKTGFSECTFTKKDGTKCPGEYWSSLKHIKVYRDVGVDIGGIIGNKRTVVWHTWKRLLKCPCRPKDTSDTESDKQKEADGQ
jgi:RHS repeat-associated protein